MEEGGSSDDVGSLVGLQADQFLPQPPFRPTAIVTESYGFGAISNGLPSIPPIGTPAITDPVDLNAMNAGMEWSADAWLFGSGAPKLKYVDSYDSAAMTYACASGSAYLPVITINCGTTLIPEQ